MDDDGKEARKALTVLKDQIVQNDDLITKLKQDISALKQANQESAKQSVPVTSVAKEQVSKPLAPKAPSVSKTQNKEETFSQTFTEPPTMPTNKKVPQAPAAPAKPQAPKVDPQANQNTPEQAPQSTKAFESDNINSNTAKAEDPAFISTTKREELFNEILPDGQETELDAFDDVSTSSPSSTGTSKQVLDLSMIFGAKESIEIQDIEHPNKSEPSVDDTEKVKLSSGLTTAIPVGEETVTDHSLRTNLPRRAVAKEGEEYSDFLGKTKSVFYRIKWSLFKE